jgi:hypothetical protein
MWRYGFGSLFLLSDYLVKNGKPRTGHVLGAALGGLTTFIYSVRLKKMLTKNESLVSPTTLLAVIGLGTGVLNYCKVKGLKKAEKEENEEDLEED